MRNQHSKAVIHNKRRRRRRRRTFGTKFIKNVEENWTVQGK